MALNTSISFFVVSDSFLVAVSVVVGVVVVVGVCMQESAKGPRKLISVYGFFLVN